MLVHGELKSEKKCNLGKPQPHSVCLKRLKSVGFFEWNDLNCGLQRALEFEIALIMISALLYNLTIEQFLMPHFAWHLYQKFLL